MSNIHDINENEPHCSTLVRCMKCLYDWRAVFPLGVNPYFLQCPKCKTAKSILIASNEEVGVATE